MSHKFQVSGMSCGHCEQAVTQAIWTLDPDAQVTVDLSTGHVDVSSQQPREAILLAIDNAGYQAQ